MRVRIRRFERVRLIGKSRYSQLVEVAGGEAEVLELEGAGHFEPVDPQSAEWPRVLALLRELLDA